jgi:transposase, IS30 family
MKQYKQLSESEREQIFVMLNSRQSVRDIAKVLSRSPSSISREVKKNHGRKLYRPHRAHDRSVFKQQNAHKRDRLKSNALRIEVENMLNNKWSPEIIAGRLKFRTDLPRISPEAIYQWIYSDAPHLIDCLVRSHPDRWLKGKSKYKRIRIPDRIPITERPVVINNRSQRGHWEADLVIGNGHAALQVLVERKSRFTKLIKIPDKSAKAASSAICSALSDLPFGFKRSITYDNGLENVLHSSVNDRLGSSSYFCQPFHSWEKGTIENTNGLIRRFLPKKTNFDTIAISNIQQVERWLNNRPRKCLDFKTPQESFESGVALTG